jgi:hypothetical protein
VTFPPELESGLSADAVMVCYSECVRCRTVFAFGLETVPSVWVHRATRCPIRPDGTHVDAGDADAAREPLCVPCAHVFRRAAGRDRPITELFPRARFGLIDVDAALRIQAGAA